MKKVVKLDSKNFELLTKWYLRFNGYFTVDNFILHDSLRISNRTVGNLTDIDVLGIRMPFQFERTGELEIKNDHKLNCIEKIDIVIAECKTGKQNGFNKAWSKGDVQMIEYVLRFCGIFKTENQITEIANTILNNLKYEDDNHRIRLVLFGQTNPSKKWQDKGLEFISSTDIINFLVRERGECWIAKGIGTKSIHTPWDPLINDIFLIANDHTKTKENREREIIEILKNSSQRN